MRFMYCFSDWFSNDINQVNADRFFRCFASLYFNGLGNFYDDLWSLHPEKVKIFFFHLLKSTVFFLTKMISSSLVIGILLCHDLTKVIAIDNRCECCLFDDGLNWLIHFFGLPNWLSLLSNHRFFQNLLVLPYWILILTNFVHFDH